jgi:hypothetical protein
LLKKMKLIMISRIPCRRMIHHFLNNVDMIF